VSKLCQTVATVPGHRAFKEQQWDSTAYHATAEFTPLLRHTPKPDTLASRQKARVAYLGHSDDHSKESNKTGDETAGTRATL
jgi:hypothetical protein